MIYLNGTQLIYVALIPILKRRREPHLNLLETGRHLSLDKIKAPILLLDGAQDERIPVKQAKAFAEKLKA
jgi:dienelactone hydrolase